MTTVIAVLVVLVVVFDAGGVEKRKKRLTCWDGRVRMDTETGEGWSLM